MEPEKFAKLLDQIKTGGKILCLEGSSFTDTQLETLLEALSNSSVEYLDLSSNNIGNRSEKKHKEESTAIVKILKNKSLKILILNENFFDSETLSAFCDALSENNTLLELQLVGNKIGDEGAGFLANALGKNRTLYSLDVSENLITEAGCELLKTSICRHPTLCFFGYYKVQIADESNTLIRAQTAKNLLRIQFGYLRSPEMSKEVSAYLKENNPYSVFLQISKFADALLREAQQRTLLFSKQQSFDSGEKKQTLEVTERKIAEEAAVERRPVVQQGVVYLNIAELPLRSVELASLLESQLDNPNLFCLNLRDVDLSSKPEMLSTSIQSLHRLLVNHVSLKVLLLGDCDLQRNEILFLLDAVKSNKTLLWLEINSRMIGDMAAKQIGLILATHPSLLCLDIEGNRIGTEGGRALALALESNATLCRLSNLDCINDTDVEAAILSKVLANKEMFHKSITSFPKIPKEFYELREDIFPPGEILFNPLLEILKEQNKGHDSGAPIVRKSAGAFG